MRATITSPKFPWRASSRLRLATGVGWCRPQRATQRVAVDTGDFLLGVLVWRVAPDELRPPRRLTAIWFFYKTKSRGLPQCRLRSDTGAGRCRPQRATKRVSEWRSQQDAKESHAGQTREATSSQTEYGHPRQARPPIEHRGRRISPVSIAALPDQGGQIQEMPNGEGSTAACVETPTLWGLSIAALRDMALSAKTGGSSCRQRCRDSNPHGLGRRPPGRDPRPD